MGEGAGDWDTWVERLGKMNKDVLISYMRVRLG